MKIEIEFSAPECCEDCRFKVQYTSLGREVNYCLLYDKYADRSEYNTENKRKIADDCITDEELLLLEEVIGYIPDNKKTFKCSKNETRKSIYDSNYRHLYEQDLVRIKEQDRSKELPDVITYYVTEKGFKIMERILKIRIKNEC